MIAAYQELAEFIAAGTTPSSVVAFRPSESTRARVVDLIQCEKTKGLSPDEAAELQQFLQIEHLIRLAKARARQYLLHE
jgi:hypothetical protein